MGSFLDTHSDERIRTVVYRVLVEQRERIRAGSSSWTALDLVAITEQSKRDVLSKNQALSKVARQQYVWSRLEGISPGELATLIDGPFTEEIVDWIVDWNRPGRPIIEGRLNQADHEAVQAWAAQHLPSSRYLLRWSLLQDQRPGQIAGFLSRGWSDQQLVEILRMWCTSEGWSPLAHAEKLLKTDKAAVEASLTRLDRSKDPLVRREASKWRQWLRRGQSRTKARQPNRHTSLSQPVR